MTMFIETRTIGKKKKYYLVHSFRKGDEVKKIRLYLGADLSKDQLAEERNIAEKELIARIEKIGVVHDPYTTMLSLVEIDELKSLEAKGDIKIKHLAKDDWTKFAESFIYDTNAIEGSSVTEDEVVDILRKSAQPRWRRDWEIEETHGVAAAVEFIRTTNTHISLDLIKKLHELCFKKSKTFAGRFRKTGENVVVVDGLGRVVHRGAPASEIIKLLTELVDWYNANKNKYSALVLAAIIHNRFELVHPFGDGNGRVGRLLLNNILLKHNKPPVNIEFENRREYYNALQEYQIKGNLRPTLELIVKQYKALKKLLKR